MDAPSAPELNSTSDLAAVAGVLDELNFEVGSSDNAELDVQSNGLQQQ
ncbi:MAG TPA: hypothetical protein VFT87_03220 [Candidatus Saccharimonadales bacterium]|nr:hypothetical protein [Candidatus Saccharimonadales bacterium]